MLNGNVITVDFALDMKGLLNLKKMIEESFADISSDSILVLKDDIGNMSSSGYSLIQNYFNLCNKSDRKCYIVAENSELFNQIKSLDSQIPIYENFNDIKYNVDAGLKAKEGYIVKDLICPICNTENPGVELVDTSAIQLKWDKDIFPTAIFNHSGEDSDLYKKNIIICPECYMASLDLVDFIQEGSRLIEPKISGVLKGILEKNINRRKAIITDTDFSVKQLRTGRAPDYMFALAYKIVLDCYNSLRFEKDIEKIFDQGFCNLMIFKFVEDKEQSYLINARNCFSEYLKEKNIDIEKKIKAMYYNMLISIMLGEMKNAMSLHKGFEDILQLDYSSKLNHIIDFWAKRALNYYEVELERVKKDSKLDF